MGQRSIKIYRHIRRHIRRHTRRHFRCLLSIQTEMDISTKLRILHYAKPILRTLKQSCYCLRLFSTTIPQVILAYLPRLSIARTVPSILAVK